jgi:hypothetical protein
MPQVRKAKRAAVKVIQKRKFQQRRRPRKSGVVTRTPSLKSSFASGIKTLVGFLPYGSALSAAADFIFKSIAWTPKTLKNPESATVALQADQVYILGNITALGINYGAILCNSRLATAVIENGQFRSGVKVNFSQMRLIDLSFKYLQSTKAGNVQGEVAFGFIPQVHPIELIPQVSNVLTFDEVTRLPGAIIGPASRSMVLNYKPDPRSMYQKDYHDLGDQIGVLFFAWQNLNRKEFTDTSPDDFSPQIEISGSYETFGRYENGIGEQSNFMSCGLMTKDYYAKKQMLLISGKPIGYDGFNEVLNDEHFTCSKVMNKPYCTVVGNYRKRGEENENFVDAMTGITISSF